MYATDIYRLNQIIDNPYFGRFDFTTNEKTDKIYVGKMSVFDNNNKLITYDWRSPICNLYYESGIGQASYTSKAGIISGTIDLKRRILIERGNLIEAKDTDVMSNDEFLTPYLEGSADKRLKTIVASIQAEQNHIIRELINKNLIVQGVAVSGKTTVALHRIAWLLYNYNDKVKSDQFIIIGPNRFFLDYISGILPDLDVNFVQQSTFNEIVDEILKGKVKIEDQTASLENLFKGKLNEQHAKIKTSLQYRDLIEQFIQRTFSDSITGDLTLGGITLCTKDYVLNNFSSGDERLLEQLDKLSKRIINKIKENNDDIRHEIWKSKKEEYLSLPKDSPKRKEYDTYFAEISKKLKNGCAKEVKEYLGLNIKPMKLYKDFINSLEFIDGIDVEAFKKESFQYLNKGIVRYEDLAGILYIGLRLNGAKEQQGFKHVVIDEAQDLGLFHFEVLRKVFPNATFSIFGDLNQSIYSFRSINDWQFVMREVFGNNCELLDLNKSYRTTNEIIEASNSVLKESGNESAISVLRYGPKVLANETSGQDVSQILSEIIIEFQIKGYKSVAIITKDEAETETIHAALKI